MSRYNRNNRRTESTKRKEGRFKTQSGKERDALHKKGERRDEVLLELSLSPSLSVLPPSCPLLDSCLFNNIVIPMVITSACDEVLRVKKLDERERCKFAQEKHSL
jgi:hypothetical protein